MEGKNKISVLFSKYVAGEANQTEIKELLELVKIEQLDNDLDREMEHLWNIQTEQTEERVDWQRIYNRAVASGPVHKKINRRVWFSAAAALFIGMISIATLISVNKHTDQGPLKYVTGKAASAQTSIIKF